MPLPLAVIAGSVVGNELRKGNVFSKIKGGISSIFKRKGNPVAKANNLLKAKGEIAKMKAAMELKKQGLTSKQALDEVNKITGAGPSVNTLAKLTAFSQSSGLIKKLGPAPGQGAGLLKAVKNSLKTASPFVVPSASTTPVTTATTTTTTNSKNMSALGSFMKGVSGGFSFGQNQKLVNIAFWVIGGIVLILIIRPFGILSGKRKR